MRAGDPPDEPPAFRALRDHALRFSIPIFATWEATYRCPMRCRHCYLAGRRKPPVGTRSAGGGEEDEFDTAEAKDLLRQAAELGVLFITFTGGEPLLRDDLFDIIDEARRLRFAWRLYTSATSIDERRAHLIAERAPLAVDVSLHGLEETHDWMTRVPGSFRRAVSAIEMLARLGVTVNAKMNLTPRGMKDLAALRELCEGVGARQRAWTSIFPDNDRRPVDEELVLSEGELRECLVELERLRPDCYGRARRRAGDEPLCGAGRNSFSVSPRGDVRACMGLKASPGNVRETPLRDIWNSPAMASYRRLAARDRADCRGCEDEAFCFFCMQLAEKETGDPLGAPPTACREARIRHEAFRRDGRAPGTTTSSAGRGGPPGPRGASSR